MTAGASQHPPAEPPRGAVSVERLVHFRCGQCERWWSIGDAPPERDQWYCPWCGHYQHFDRSD